MNILIIGTPGVGKTTISIKLSLDFKLNYFNLNTIFYYFNMFSGFDKIRNSRIIKINKNKTLLINFFKKITNSIIDTHIDNIPFSNIDVVFVIRRNPLVLIVQLKKKYKEKRKIIENVESEFINLISDSIHSKFDKRIPVLDVASYKQIYKSLKDIRITKKESTKVIDWIRILSKTNAIDKYYKHINNFK